MARDEEDSNFQGDRLGLLGVIYKHLEGTPLGREEEVSTRWTRNMIIRGGSREC